MSTEKGRKPELSLLAQFPEISLVFAGFLLIGLASLIFVLGLYVGSLHETETLRFVFVAAATLCVMVGLIFVLLWLYESLVKQVAPFVLTPYGLHDIPRAQMILRTFLRNPQQAILIIQNGQVTAGSKQSLLRETRKGPGKIRIDSESAVLLGVNGTPILYQAGDYELGARAEIYGIIDLRPQAETLELANVLTSDGLPVKLKATLRYQIEQDEPYFELYRVRKTWLPTAFRALLPRDEWKNKTIAAFRAETNQIICEYELGQLFIAHSRLDSLDLHAAVHGFASRAPVQAGRAQIQKEIERRLTDLAQKWGVKILNVTIEDLVPPKEILPQVSC